MVVRGCGGARRARRRHDGQHLSEESVVENIDFLCAICDELDLRATVFELTTAMSLLEMEKRKCDIGVLEVGLGGRLDATNVHPSPLVCGVSSLGIDHTAVSVAAHRQGVK